jgi:hypothetical protein
LGCKYPPCSPRIIASTIFAFIVGFERSIGALGSTPVTCDALAINASVGFLSFGGAQVETICRIVVNGLPVVAPET